MRVTVHPPTGEDWEQPSAAEFLRLYDEGAFVPVPEVVELPDGRVVLDQSPAAERRLRRHNMWMRSLRVEVASQHVRTTARPRVRSREMSHAPRRAARSTPKAAQRSGDSGDDLPAPEAALAALFLLVYPFGGWTS